MKRELGIFFAIVVLLAVSLYYVLNAAPPAPTLDSGREITTEQLRDILAGSEHVSILMQLGPDNGKNRLVINCAIGIAKSMGTLGKDVKNYGFEGGYCIKPDLTNVTRAECIRELAGNYLFEVRYGADSTKFYEKKTLISVDENFTGECSISVPQQPS